MSRNATLRFEPGEWVVYQGENYCITRVLDLSSVLLMHERSKQLCHASVNKLSPLPVSSENQNKPDLTILDDKWEEAVRRFEIIKPLLDAPERTRAVVTEHAQKHNLHTNTLYNWLKNYQETELLTSLLPNKRRDTGETKVVQEVEAIIAKAIESEYLTKQRKSPAKVHTEVKRLCHNAGLQAPGKSTVYRRIKRLPAKQVVKKREGSKQAEKVYNPIEGEFPDANFPYQVLQIDHTPIDLILVDDTHRLPIGRPWITLAIDVNSRMVAGYYVSFDPPGAQATGQCVSNAILPKDSWLAKHNIQAEWPCWGIPGKLHMDNAKEFRGKMLQRACQQYGIDIEWRPVAKPHFGSHIERLLGTFSETIHALPGTTFSNTQQKGEYDSEKKSALTLSEFEEWFANKINLYHHDLHSGIKMPPIEKYRRGILGTDDAPGIGLPARITDELRLRLDFMPFIERTVQDYGVVIDEIHYYHDVLRRWINAKDPVHPKNKRKFMFRRDPRDISCIWFFDPELSEYYAIPYRNISAPPMSIWEFREAKHMAKEDGKNHVDEDQIFAALNRMHEIVAQAETKTASARRATQRRKFDPINNNISKPSNTPPENISTQPESTIPAIEPFDDLDELI